MMLLGLLNTVSSGYYPSDSDDNEDDPTFFDEDEPEHLSQLWRLLKACLDAAPGFQGRVIFGAATMMDQRNEVIDPDDDCLSLHPKLKAALDDAERYRWLCGQMFRNDSGHLDIGGEIACNWHDPNKGEIDRAIDAAMPEAIDEPMAMPANAGGNQPPHKAA